MTVIYPCMRLFINLAMDSASIMHAFVMLYKQSLQLYKTQFTYLESTHQE